MQHKPLTMEQMKWLKSKGVSIQSISTPYMLEYSENLGIYIPEHNAYYDIKAGTVSSQDWCLGEYSTGTASDPIKILPHPLDFLRNRHNIGQSGIFIVNWFRLFDELSHFDAVHVHSSLIEKYNHYMRPILPEVTTYDAI